MICCSLVAFVLTNGLGAFGIRAAAIHRAASLWLWRGTVAALGLEILLGGGAAAALATAPALPVAFGHICAFAAR